jgi:hypothetical protein
VLSTSLITFKTPAQWCARPPSITLPLSL